MNERILVVEDEATLQETLAYNLKKLGYVVEVVGDGNAALEAAPRFAPDLILLDIMLPGMDGIEVCRVIRQEMNMPILFLTARDDEIDRVIGLEIGGDDYIVKPFSMRELLARVKAHLRTTQNIREQVASENVPPSPEEQRKIYGNLCIDERRREISVDDKPVPMKPKEFELMLFFARHQGRMISREYILNNVWNYSYTGDSRTVDVHVRWLREKIEEDPSRPIRIVTIRGDGYRFEG
jgi:DNA-binding response OmpR family regulator